MIIKFIHSIKDIPSAQWHELFSDNPFTHYEFLAALESNGCTNSQTGWTPHHLVVLQDDSLIAAMPCFIKNHSYGEYVFDWAWAEAYQQHNLNYYPKLTTAIPFTPSTGQRIALHPCITSTVEHELIISKISHAIIKETNILNASSWHCLFPSQALSEQLHTLGHTTRTGVQYHWKNKHYKTFEDFLGHLKSRKRKSIRKERKSVIQQGIELNSVEGSDISPELIQQFYRFYQTTYIKRSRRQGYLSLSFFNKLLHSMPAKLLMVCAYKEQQLIATALFFKNSETLFGRYWGASKEYDALHFEACYYQGIEYCIKHNIQYFDPGAQGEHKISRGFEPIKTYSNHLVLNPNFKRAIDEFIEDEAQHIEQYIEQLKITTPYRGDD